MALEKDSKLFVLFAWGLMLFKCSFGCSFFSHTSHLPCKTEEKIFPCLLSLSYMVLITVTPFNYPYYFDGLLFFLVVPFSFYLMAMGVGPYATWDRIVYDLVQYLAWFGTPVTVWTLFMEKLDRRRNILARKAELHPEVSRSMRTCNVAASINLDLL